MTVLRSGSATDVGRVRKTNEDLPLEANNLYAVADGMGGHVGGEVAARVAVETLLQEFTREPTTAGLRGAFAGANRAVWQESQSNSKLRGMGTTLTAVALVAGQDGKDTLVLANVGDSWAYLFSEGRIVQVTADHSLAEERMRHGEMTEEEAAVHPQRHILTRALGISFDVDSDMWELQLQAGDRLVLCSDGLSNELGPEELTDVLGTVPDPAEAAQQLVDEANAHGGSDNITVVVVDVLVGEEGTGEASVITPLGGRGGSPLLLPHGSASTGTLPRTDTLAPGARLGFSGQDRALSSDEPSSGEFFLGNTQAVPVARSTVRTAAPARPTVPAIPKDESRRARRRRLGIPRRITLRVVLFILLVLAIPTAAFFAIRWYAYDNWFLTVHHNEVVIHQGRLGGVLWFHSKVVDTTDLTTTQLLPTGITQIKAGVQEPSLADAKKYVANLHNEYVFLRDAARKAKASASTTTTTLGGTISGATTTPTTAPIATTTIPAAATPTSAVGTPVTAAEVTTASTAATTTTPTIVAVP